MGRRTIALPDSLTIYSEKLKVKCSCKKFQNFCKYLHEALCKRGKLGKNSVFMTYKIFQTLHVKASTVEILFAKHLTTRQKLPCVS